MNLDKYDENGLRRAADGAPPIKEVRSRYRVHLPTEAQMWLSSTEDRLRYPAAHSLGPTPGHGCEYCRGTRTLGGSMCDRCGGTGRSAQADRQWGRDPDLWYRVHDLFPDDPSIRALAALGIVLFYVPIGSVQSPNTIGRIESPCTVAWRVGEGTKAWSARVCLRSDGPPVGSNGFVQGRSK